MKKILFLIIVTFSLLNADTAREELTDKIAYALTCNSKMSNISEVEISILKPSRKYHNSYIVSGVYKSVLSFSGNKGAFGMGDEFHPLSGSFKGIVDSNLELKKLKWKVSFGKGYVRQECLKLNEDDL